MLPPKHSFTVRWAQQTRVRAHLEGFCCTCSPPTLSELKLSGATREPPFQHFPDHSPHAACSAVLPRLRVQRGGPHALWLGTTWAQVGFRHSCMRSVFAGSGGWLSGGEAGACRAAGQSLPVVGSVLLSLHRQSSVERATAQQHRRWVWWSTGPSPCLKMPFLWSLGVFKITLKTFILFLLKRCLRGFL